MGRRAAVAALAGAMIAVVPLSACSLDHTQSALAPAGPQAARVEGLWWIAFWIAAGVYALTIAALLVAALHGRRRLAAPVVIVPEATERRAGRWIAGAVGATIVVLLVFLVVDLFTGRSLAATERPTALTIRVTGFQWWWRIEYRDTVPSRTVTTANEIHIPVGRPVVLELASGDVIHSFWVPNLHGKRDLVPGLRNRLWIQADRAGLYRGACAEFCGHQHAKMGLLVVAEPQAQFDAWYARQLQDAELPVDSVRAAGLGVFLARPCAMCHTVRGTPAAGRVAPDLTHLASRRTLAAAAIPNTRGHLGGWITDPQGVKPGTRMPPTTLPPHELHALLAYLEGLR